MNASNISGTSGPAASRTTWARLMLARIPSAPSARPWAMNHFWPEKPAAASSWASARTVAGSCGAPSVLT
jgi:hypothetical protein